MCLRRGAQLGVAGLDEVKPDPATTAPHLATPLEHLHPIIPLIPSLPFPFLKPRMGS